MEDDTLLRHLGVPNPPATRPTSITIDCSAVLRLTSYARPAKLFTAHESLFVLEAGVLSAESLKRITDEVVSVIQRNA